MHLNSVKYISDETREFTLKTIIDLRSVLDNPKWELRSFPQPVADLRPPSLYDPACAGIDAQAAGDRQKINLSDNGQQRLHAHKLLSAFGIS